MTIFIPIESMLSLNTRIDQQLWIQHIANSFCLGFDKSISVQLNALIHDHHFHYICFQ